MARLLLLPDGFRPRRPRHRSTPHHALLLLLVLLGLVTATTTALGAQAAEEPSMVPAINGTLLVFPTGEGAVVAEADRSASVCASNRSGPLTAFIIHTHAGADVEVLIAAAPAGGGGGQDEGHTQLRLRRAQDAGCVISYTVYTAAFQVRGINVNITYVCLVGSVARINGRVDDSLERPVLGPDIPSCWTNPKYGCTSISIDAKGMGTTHGFINISNISHHITHRRKKCRRRSCGSSSRRWASRSRSRAAIACTCDIFGRLIGWVG